MGINAYIGDSYSSGYLLPDPAKRWTSLYCKELGETELNVSVPGSGFTQPGATGKTYPQQAELVVAAGADTVWVSGGHNDSVATTVSDAQIQAAIEKTFSTLRGGLPDATIIAVLPFWHYLQPSERILRVATWVEASARKYGATVIGGAAWWRVDRKEWSFDDGHPNEAGHQLMANVIKSWTCGEIPGETFGSFPRTQATDASFGHSSAGTNLAGGTIFNAQPGLWRIEGTACLYGATPGFLYASGGTTRKTVRADVTNSPFPFPVVAYIRHTGGDLRIAVGYNPNGTTSVIGNGSTHVEALRVSR
jgi:lysophospholipase L1-like esterase